MLFSKPWSCKLYNFLGTSFNKVYMKMLFFYHMTFQCTLRWKCFSKVSSTYYQKVEWTVLMNCSVKLKVPVRIHLQKDTNWCQQHIAPYPLPTFPYLNWWLIPFFALISSCSAVTLLVMRIRSCRAVSTSSWLRWRQSLFSFLYLSRSSSYCRIFSWNA